MTLAAQRNSQIAKLAQKFGVTYSEARAELEAESWVYADAEANLRYAQNQQALAQVPVINQ